MLMVKYFRSEDGKIRERTEPETGGWIALTNPTAAEILEVSARYVPVSRRRIIIR